MISVVVRCAHSSTSRPLRRFSLGLIAALTLTLPAAAQPPHPLSASEQQRVESLLKQMSLEQKLAYIGGTGFAVRAVPELKIPAIEMSDGPYGTRSNAGLPSTTYAAGIGMAASWDRALAARVGTGIGRDARARGVHIMLAPGVNIYRSPRNGRNFEYLGEDPFLAGQMAVGYIQGMQAQGVSATVKHYLGNNSEYLRHDSDTVVAERTAREIYLPAFEAAVKQGHVSAVMDSYNLIDGEHATQNPRFNIDILRKQWGFQGILMSDWYATYDAVGAANGGLDIEMPRGKFMNAEKLLPAIKAGTVSEATTIDEKVRRLLTVEMEYGWLDRDQRDTSISFLDAANQLTALDSARESAVLLKNANSLLPLDKAALKTILVVGPEAYPGVPVGGGSAGVVPFQLVGAFEGIQQQAGAAVKVLYNEGVPALSRLASGTRLKTSATGGKDGVTVEMFANGNLKGPAAQTAVMPQIGGPARNYSVASSAPDGRVSSRFTGFYEAPATGRYQLVLTSGGENGGSRLLVDGQPVVDDWTLVRAFQPVVTMDLTAGPHQVVVEAWRGGRLDRLMFAIAAENKLVNPEARLLASQADVVIVAAGFNSDSESEGGDRTFTLPFGQDELIREIVAANPRTVVALTSGGNVDSSSWLDRVPALLATWYGGQAEGTALAEILFGQVNPSGHLPATFERRAEDNPTFATYYPQPGTQRVEYKEGIFVGYRGYEKNGVQPLFPFGFGLSYTTFQFANLKVTTSGNGQAVKATATFDVTNTGKRRGAEVAQLYIGEEAPKVPRPVHELKGFERVELAPGETRHITIPLDARSFSYWNEAAKAWTIGSDNFTVSVGDSVANLPLKTAVVVSR